MRKGKTKRSNDGVHSLVLFRRRLFCLFFCLVVSPTRSAGGIMRTKSRLCWLGGSGNNVCRYLLYSYLFTPLLTSLTLVPVAQDQ